MRRERMTVPLTLDIERLTVEERIELAQALWDSIEPKEDDEVILSEAQLAELDRRLDDCERHPEAGLPWEEVRHALLSKLQ
jgi:putative addiction module component (TIGR02574 family)